jgi:hypothetical protein
MMKAHRILWSVLFSVIFTVLAVGCVTATKSFNRDYNENIPPQPNYAIDNVDDRHFKIRLSQGTPMPEQRAVCVMYMKKAIWTIANNEGKRRGWQQWEVNYIQERDQGWQHILVCVVIRDK